MYKVWLLFKINLLYVRSPNKTCNLIECTAVELQRLPCFTFTANLCTVTYLNDKMTHGSSNVWKLGSLRSIICK